MSIDNDFEIVDASSIVSTQRTRRAKYKVKPWTYEGDEKQVARYYYAAARMRKRYCERNGIPYDEDDIIEWRSTSYNVKYELECESVFKIDPFADEEKYVGEWNEIDSADDDEDEWEDEDECDL